MSVQIPGGTTVPTFGDLGLPQAVVDVLAANGIETPFPIQAATLPDSLSGRDVLGRGRTGSGKTYAFLLPMVTRLTTSQTKRAPGRPRALILAPTRELVAQIDAALAPLAAATNLRSVTVFGGVSPAATDSEAAPGCRHRDRLPRPTGRPREVPPRRPVRR